MMYIEPSQRRKVTTMNEQLELFPETLEDEFVESTFEEQYENGQFAQDGDFENMSAADML